MKETEAEVTRKAVKSGFKLAFGLESQLYIALFYFFSYNHSVHIGTLKQTKHPVLLGDDYIKYNRKVSASLPLYLHGEGPHF